MAQASEQTTEVLARGDGAIIADRLGLGSDWRVTFWLWQADAHGLSLARASAVIFDGYIRVSEVRGRSGERFISPDVQRETVERWAALRGVEIAMWHVDLDQSGGALSRPGLDALMRRIRSGQTEGVAVAYLDRLSRAGVADALRLVEEIHSHGGQLAMVDLGVDPTTVVGEFATTVMLALARMERRRVVQRWTEARERAVARGVYLHPTPPGYRRLKSGRLAVHPIEGPVVTELFRRYAAGARYDELRRLLKDAGLRTARGLDRWDTATIRRLLDLRAYLGEVRVGTLVTRGAHPALVDLDTWKKAQVTDKSYPFRRAQKTPLLRGILRCAGCRRPMSCNSKDRDSSRERRWYVCTRVGDEERCGRPAQISDARVEPYIEGLFWEQVERPTLRRADRRLDTLRGEVARRKRELESYRDNGRLPVALGPTRFAEGVRVRAARYERVAARLSQAEAKAGVYRMPQVDELRSRWPTMSFEDRRAAIAEVIDCVFVAPRRTQSVADRLFVCLNGCAPPDLPPHLPRQRHGLTPFDPGTCPPAATRRGRSIDWSETQIQRELDEFLAGRDEWPCFRDFQTPGRIDLWEQVERQGGERRWAARMGVHYKPPPTDIATWPEERVRAELATYLAHRTTWPTSKEFVADGRGRLRCAVKWHGGPSRWATEMGVDLIPQRSSPTRWTEARILAEMRSFAGNRTDWPRLREFHAAGRRPLYDAIRVRDLRHRLAAQLDLRLAPSMQRDKRRQWTEPAIRAALDELVKGRAHFPGARDFDAAGLTGLYLKLMRDGTRDEWARRYALTLAPPRNRVDEGLASSGLPSSRAPVGPARPSAHRRALADSR